MYHSIKDFITTQIDPNFNKDDELPFPTSFKTFSKNSIITHYHHVEQNAYFLIDGMVRISMQREEEERILEFFFPNSFFSSYTSFLTQSPSDVEIQALTDIQVEIIHYNDLQKAYQTSLLANQLGRIVAEHYYIWKTKREKDFLLKSATERYNELLAKRPELVQQIPVHMIAKYLGIKPESLSRIRKEIS
ncbi:MAG TPA: cyclic nucleotide-binding domain-containing protein [Chitinophagaceae bacterium]|nr:cyclic nucleotide-binding domain-containing protein [Chitinophagaceae bacterium]